MAGPSKSAIPNLNTPNPQFTFSLDTPSLSSGTLDKYLKSVLGEDSSNAIPEILRQGGQREGLRKDMDVSASSVQVHPDEKQHTPSVQTVPITSTTPTTAAAAVMSGNTPMPPSHPSSQSMGQHPSMSNPDLSMHADPSSGQQLATTNDNNELIPVPRGQNYVDITEYLNMPQADAAKKLGIPPSTLSKRWKEAVRKRKWPYRMICKIDKEIMTLLHNVPQGPNAPPLPEEIETALGISLRKRQEELRPVVIRI